MASFATLLKTILVTRLVGTDTNTPTASIWVIKIGKMLPTPNRLICLYDTGGLNPNPSWLLDYPTAQVLVRGEKHEYENTFNKAAEVKDCLLGNNAQVVGSSRIDGILQLSDIAFLKYDDNDRPIFSLNFRAFVEPATNALTNRNPL